MRVNNVDQQNLYDWKKLPSTIGFRLDREHTTCLSQRATALKMSLHDLARHYTVHMLHENDERQQLLATIGALQAELAEARKDIAIATLELLVSAGGATASQAKGWVKENLLQQ